MCALYQAAEVTSYLLANTFHYHLLNTKGNCCHIDSYCYSHVIYLHLYICLCTGRIFVSHALLLNVY